MKHLEFKDETGKVIPSRDLPPAFREATVDQIIVFNGILAGTQPKKIWDQVCEEVPDEKNRKVTMRWISRMMVNYQRAAIWNEAFVWALDRIKVDTIPIMRPAWRLNQLQKQYAQAEERGERRAILKEARGESLLLASLIRPRPGDERARPPGPQPDTAGIEGRVDRLLDSDKGESLMASPAGSPGYPEDGHTAPHRGGSVGAPDVQVDGAQSQNHPQGHEARADSTGSE